ncbi:DnaB-like helicase N-terminal domain-containing protein [Streptomyces stramineus]
MSTGLQGLPGREVIVMAEQALLGALLIQPRTLTAVSEWLEPEHFYLPHHTALYSAMHHIAKVTTRLSPKIVQPPSRDWSGFNRPPHAAQKRRPRSRPPTPTP